MSYRSGDPISIADVYQALANEGPVEAACVNLCVHPYRPMVISTVATVTFAFVDDFKDAVKVSITWCLFHSVKWDLSLMATHYSAFNEVRCSVWPRPTLTAVHLRAVH